MISFTDLRESYVHVYNYRFWVDSSTSQKAKFVFPNVFSSSRARSNFPELPVICKCKEQTVMGIVCVMSIYTRICALKTYFHLFFECIVGFVAGKIVL